MRNYYAIALPYGNIIDGDTGLLAGAVFSFSSKKRRNSWVEEKEYDGVNLRRKALQANHYNVVSYKKYQLLRKRYPGLC